MQKNEEIKKDKRKESVSSSKSEDISGSESNEEVYIPIKKEKSNYQIIDNKLFDKIVQYIKNINSFQEKLKLSSNFQNINHNQNFEQNKLIKSLTNEISIISNKKNEKQNTEEDNTNNNF